MERVLSFKYMGHYPASESIFLYMRKKSMMNVKKSSGVNLFFIETILRLCLRPQVETL